jgi:hypothetical protein
MATALLALNKSSTLLVFNDTEKQIACSRSIGVVFKDFEFLTGKGPPCFLQPFQFQQ